MARDFRNSPDSEVIDPDSCGHAVSVGSTAIECDVKGDHDGHSAMLPGMARRSPLGSGDVEAADVRIEWSDERPPATVGDVRRLIREAEAEK